jgi:hypothetical protein
MANNKSMSQGGMKKKSGESKQGRQGMEKGKEKKSGGMKRDQEMY